MISNRVQQSIQHNFKISLTKLLNIFIMLPVVYSTSPHYIDKL